MGDFLANVKTFHHLKMVHSGTETNELKPGLAFLKALLVF